MKHTNMHIARRAIKRWCRLNRFEQSGLTMDRERMAKMIVQIHEKAEPRTRMTLSYAMCMVEEILWWIAENATCTCDQESAEEDHKNKMSWSQWIWSGLSRIFM